MKLRVYQFIDDIKHLILERFEEICSCHDSSLAESAPGILHGFDNQWNNNISA
jgi:hypothetical protein